MLRLLALKHALPLPRVLPQRHVLAWALATSLLVSAPTATVGQVTEPELASALDRRPLAELVAELPGRSVSLDRLREVALARSLPLESARVRRSLAEAGVSIEGGDFDLGLSFTAELARSRGLSENTGVYRAGVQKLLPWGTVLGADLAGTRQPSFSGPGSTYDADVGLALSQPLLEGLGTTDSALRAARWLRNASIHDLARSSGTVLASVELGYLRLAEAEAVVAVLLRSYEIAEALLYRNEQLSDRQLVAEVDVITARSGVALRRSLLVDARRDRVDASDALVFLVWGEGATEEIARDTVPLKTAPVAVDVPQLRTLDQEVSSALEMRRDLAAARAALRGADVVAQATDRGRLPSLSLDGAVRSGGSESSLGGSLGALDRGWSWSLGLAFSQPLQNRRDRGLDRDAELTRELRRIEVVTAENRVQQDMREAVRAIRAGVERLEAATEASELAGAQLAAERRRLDLGLGDSFRLLETEENAVQAELESVRARFDLARAITRYRLASGALSR